jgi:hypothetical protein
MAAAAPDHGIAHGHRRRAVDPQAVESLESPAAPGADSASAQKLWTISTRGSGGQASERAHTDLQPLLAEPCRPG